jgi:hypothetical protein
LTILWASKIDSMVNPHATGDVLGKALNWAYDCAERPWPGQS